MINSVQVFKILNFSVVIGLFVYLIRRYGILQIMTLMRTERQERQDLKSQLRILQDDCDQIDTDMKVQEQSYRLMKDKFQIWQQQVMAQDDKEAQEFEVRQKMIQQNYLKKLQSLQKRMLIKKELPGLIQEASEELKISFAHRDQQKKYTSQIITLLEKSNV